MPDASPPPAPPSPPRWRHHLPRLRAVAFGAVLAVSVLPRLASLDVLFQRGEIIQWDGDSAYHLKRILHAISSFPDLPRFDPGMNWPEGAACPWTDGFDLLAAGWGLVAGLGDAQRALMAALGFTTLLALLAVWAAMDLARLVVPEGPAREGAVIAAGMLTSLVPSAVYQSQVGFLDHHVAELLAFLLLAGWSLRRHRPGGEGPLASPARWELGGALAITFAGWVFAGGVLYVAMAFAVVFAAVLRDERPRFVGSGAPALLAAGAVLALLDLPALAAHGRTFSYQFPSMLQPLLVAGAGAAVACAALGARLARGPGRRAALLLGVGLVAIAAAALIAPQALGEVRAGVEGWLLRRDPWIASVSEFQPFGWNSESFLLALYHAFGAIGVLAPLVLAAGAWATVRATGGRGVAFVALSVGFVLLTLQQVRFERIGQPLLMINAAAALAAFAHRKRASSQEHLVGAFPVVAGLVLVASDPTLRTSFEGGWIRIPPVTTASFALRDIARGARDFGVHASWDQGHYLSVTSGVPTTTNGFGSYLDPETFTEGQRVLTADGAALDAFLAARRVRYVVAGTLSGTLFDVRGRHPFVQRADAPAGVLDLDYMRSFGTAPLIIGGSAIPGADVRHLERLMPIYATPEQPKGLAFALPALWIYERVPGARLVGRAPPGRRVVASLPFREQGRPHVWRAFTDAGTNGEFELVVPFPTGLLRPGLTSEARLALQVDGGPTVEVAVPEGAVREGAEVRIGAPLKAGSRAASPQAGGGASGSASVKTAPPPGRLATEISPPKDSAIP